MSADQQPNRDPATSTPRRAEVTRLMNDLAGCDALSEWERGFVQSIARQWRRMYHVTHRQHAKLSEVWMRHFDPGRRPP